jgi:hypothetical protein
MKTTLVRSAAALAALGFTLGAEARTVRDEPYSLDTTWNAAIRLVRVDMGLAIQERDREIGYFTFIYREGVRAVPGSVEVVRTEMDGRSATRIIVQIPQMPTYTEAMMLTRLGRKLRTEYGEPPPPVRRPPAGQPGQPPGRDPPLDALPRPPSGDAPPSQPTQPPSGANPPSQPQPPQPSPPPSGSTPATYRVERPPVRDDDD